MTEKSVMLRLRTQPSSMREISNRYGRETVSALCRVVHGPVTLLLLILLCALSLPVFAHPLDEANIYHFFTVKPTANGLRLDYRPLVGGLVVYKMWDRMDTDHNGVLSEAEQKAFTQKIIGTLSARLDGQPLMLKLESFTLPEKDDFITGTVPYLQFTLRAEWKNLASGEHTLEFVTQAFADLTNVYLRADIAAPETLAAKATTGKGQKGFTLSFQFPKAAESKSAKRVSVSVTRAKETPAKPGEMFFVLPEIAPKQGVAVIGMGFLREPAVFAAEPKVEAERKAKAIIKVETPVPVMKAAAVRVPGRAASLVPEPEPPSPSRTLQTLQPFLTGQSGLLMALMLAMGLGAVHALLPGHSKAVVGAYLVGTKGSVGDALFLGGVVTATHTGIVLLFGLLLWNVERFLPERIQPWLQVLSGLLVALLGLGMLAKGLRKKNHPAEEEDRPDFTPRSGLRPSKGTLLSLGLAGGLVPCSDALILLLFAHSQNRTALGLLLVMAFGAGMATVLCAIGIAVVKAHKTLTRFLPAEKGRFLRSLPVFSAACVLLLGLWLTGSALVTLKF